MYPRIFKEGQKFSKLTIVDPYIYKKGGKWFHKMVCECGNEKHINGIDAKRGMVQSCGCFNVDSKITHGRSGTVEHNAWTAMMGRCGNKNNGSYKNYGGRGITVSKSWKSFDTFFRDMGIRPGIDFSVERVDNEKGYSKSNCIWADRSTQAINQRIRADNKTGVKGVYTQKGAKGYLARITRNKIVTHLGTFKTLEEAAIARRQAEKDYIKQN